MRDIAHISDLVLRANKLQRRAGRAGGKRNLGSPVTCILTTWLKEPMVHKCSPIISITKNYRIPITSNKGKFLTHVCITFMYKNIS
jgi:hypothetical protein